MSNQRITILTVVDEGAVSAHAFTSTDALLAWTADEWGANFAEVVRDGHWVDPDSGTQYQVHGAQVIGGSEPRDSVIRAIAKLHALGPLETRGADALDIREQAAWSIKAALEAAYEAGRAHQG